MDSRIIAKPELFEIVQKIELKEKSRTFLSKSTFKKRKSQRRKKK